MCGWVAASKRQFFAVLVVLIAVEVVVVVLLARAEHDRFSLVPMSANYERLRVGKLRSIVESRPVDKTTYKDSIDRVHEAQ